MHSKEILMSYLDVTRGLATVNEWISTCFGGDMLRAGQWISRMVAAGVNLPCGTQFPQKV